MPKHQTKVACHFNGWEEDAHKESVPLGTRHRRQEYDAYLRLSIFTSRQKMSIFWNENNTGFVYVHISCYNIRVAKVLLQSFEEMYIRINEHLLTIGHKTPEYTINGKLGDRKNWGHNLVGYVLVCKSEKSSLNIAMKANGSRPLTTFWRCKRYGLISNLSNISPVILRNVSTLLCFVYTLRYFIHFLGLTY